MALATELLKLIVDQLDARDATSAIDLCRFSECSRTFREVASERQLWRRLHEQRWRRHTSRAFFIDLCFMDNGDSDMVDWKERYGKRHVQDRKAIECVQTMVREPVGRYAEAGYILDGVRMGVYDALLERFNALEFGAAAYEKLAEKLWLKEVLDALRRSESLQTWFNSLMITDDYSAPVTCISAFSGFRGADRVEMEDKLNALAEFVKRCLGQDYLDSQPEPRELSTKICRAMASRGIKATSAAQFHRLPNAFLNLVIDNGLSTLPMSLVCIFCAISQRLGLEACVINFPGRILARVSGWRDAYQNLSDKEEDAFMLDVFDSGRILAESDVQIRLSQIGIPPSSAANFLRPAAPSEVITRVGRNIIESLTREEGGIMGSSDNARSAHAAVAALLFIQPMVDALPNILHQFPMDLYSIERDYMPIVQREGAEGLVMSDRLGRIKQTILERDAQMIEPRIRAQEVRPEEGDDKEILYKIGTIFRHRRWGYVGVIKRWDPRCCADEVWIQGNNVDGLDNGGRHQPFYSISADDGSDRYIAQVNVLPMKTVALETLHRIVRSHEDIGRTFTEADPQRAIFLMDEAHRRKYPEDAAWQADLLSREPEGAQPT